MRSLTLVVLILLAVAGVPMNASGDGVSLPEAGVRRSFAFTFVCRVVVEEVPSDARQVRTWLPVPVSSAEQTIKNVSVQIAVGDDASSASLEEVGGIQAVGEVLVRIEVADIENGAGRSLFVETKGHALELELRFDVTRYETVGGGGASPQDLRAALEANGLIPLDGRVAEVAGTLPAEDNPLATARILYDHTLDRLRYDKPSDTAWGRGDAEWACDSRHGNCTDFHSYFIGLARTKGIPARFEMGFAVPGGADREARVSGYHCWAWFHVDGRGWVPVDISEADKHPERRDYFFGRLDEHRVTMTRGRDLLLHPRPKAGALNFFVYPHVEVDGEPWSGVKRSFLRIRR